MAEIRTSGEVTLRDGNRNLFNRRFPTTSDDQSGDNYSAGIQSISTSVTTLDVSSDVASLGFAFFYNRDDTNFVTVGYDDGSSGIDPVTQIPPERFSELWCDPSQTLVAQADTAAVNLEFAVFER